MRIDIQPETLASLLGVRLRHIFGFPVTLEEAVSVIDRTCADWAVDDHDGQLRLLARAMKGRAEAMARGNGYEDGYELGDFMTPQEETKWMEEASRTIGLAITGKGKEFLDSIPEEDRSQRGTEYAKKVLSGE